MSIVYIVLVIGGFIKDTTELKTHIFVTKKERISITQWLQFALHSDLLLKEINVFIKRLSVITTLVHTIRV